jgi:hypothetical protein
MHTLPKQLDPTNICDFNIMHVYDLFRAIFFDVVSRQLRGITSALYSRRVASMRRDRSHHSHCVESLRS